MNMEVLEINRYEWQAYCAGPAFRAVFGYEQDPSFDAIDRTLVVVNTETNSPVAYVPLRDINRELVQWRFGGAFAEISKTIHVAKAYDLLIEKCRERYFFVSTLISNQNVPSLKLALAKGFRVTGVQNYLGEILVELLLDLRKENADGH